MVEEKIDNELEIPEFLSGQSLQSPENSGFNITSSNHPENVIWEQLQCEIPYQEVTNIEQNNLNSKPSTSKKSEKINIISVDVVAPEKITNRKVYQKKEQYCLFCQKLVKRFARHITAVHKHVEEVQGIIALEKNTAQRRKLIDKLRAKGNYLFNHKDVNSYPDIVARRPINKSCPKEYMDCPVCLIRISKISLRRHVRKCNMSILSTRTTQIDSRRVTFDLHKVADPILKDHVFPAMRNDLCTQVIRKDYLAILYGNKLVAKYSSPHHYKMIRANLRYIGKYLIEIRKLTPNITDFKSCFAPTHYDSTIKAIRNVARFDKEKGEYRAPYSAAAIGTILKFCCAILESDYIKRENMTKIPEVQNFLKLLQTELSTDINKTVLENLTTLRRSKKVILPTASDMSILISYLRSRRDAHFKKISHKFSYEIWKKLASYAVVGIMVYNGRRPGEIQRLTIADYTESATSSTDNPDLFEGCANEKKYTRCVLRGKLARNVSIVLSGQEVHCIKSILDHRESAGVSRDNPYVFGLPSKKPFKVLNAGVLLKKFADEAGVQYPERLYATNIRKNLATKSTNLTLNSDEKEHIMNFMGHSESIHKTIYRQPDMKKDITIMPRVLDFATGNKSHSKDETPKTKNIRDTPCSSSDQNVLLGIKPTLAEENMNLKDDSCELDESDSSLDLDQHQFQPKRKRRLIGKHIL